MNWMLAELLGQFQTEVPLSAEVLGRLLGKELLEISACHACDGSGREYCCLRFESETVYLTHMGNYLPERGFRVKEFALSSSATGPDLDGFVCVTSAEEPKWQQAAGQRLLVVELMLNLRFPHFLGIRFVLANGVCVSYHGPLDFPDIGNEMPKFITVGSDVTVDTQWRFIPWMWRLR